jgi:lysophospholipase L1-like esterase
MQSVRLALLIALFLTTGGAFSIQREATAQQNESNGAYIALGDSIAFGVGSSLPDRRGYPALVHGLLETSSGSGLAHVNLGVPGETAASFIADGQLEALLQELAAFGEAGIPVDIITVTLGGNEMLAQQTGATNERQAALSDFRTSLDQAVARIRDEVGDGASIVLTTYYDLSEGDPSIPSTDAWWIEQFNAVIRQTAESEGASVADLNEPFRGRIGDYTHYPYDVHPKNQGYRAIAAQVWSAIGLDMEPPVIQVVSDPEATRRMPTLQLEIADNVNIAQVRVSLDGRSTQTPVDLGDGHYVLLLDLRDDEADEYSVRIEAEDSAGNVGQVEHRVVVNTD